MDVVAAAKRYVADDRYRLRLFDAVADEVRRVVDALKSEQFSVMPPWSQEAFRSRIAAFDGTVADLCITQAVIGRWGGATSHASLTLAVRHLCEGLEVEGGNERWRALQWYPVLLLFYASGVAAIAAERCEALVDMMHTIVRARHEDKVFVLAVAEGFERERDASKLLEGHDRHKLPFSEYTYDRLRPLVGDPLFLGSDYERAFDRFELLYAIEYAHRSDRTWVPIGRFGWKGSRSESTPMHLLMKEAETAGDRWPPLLAGLCGGSTQRLNSLIQELLPRLEELRW